MVCFSVSLQGWPQVACQTVWLSEQLVLAWRLPRAVVCARPTISGTCTSWGKKRRLCVERCAVAFEGSERACSPLDSCDRGDPGLKCTHTQAWAHTQSVQWRDYLLECPAALLLCRSCLRGRLYQSSFHPEMAAEPKCWKKEQTCITSEASS